MALYGTAQAMFIVADRPQCHVHCTCRIYTVLRNVTLFLSCGLTNIYNIWHIVYRVNFQHKNYWSTRLTCVLLLHYRREKVNSMVLTLATNVTHCQSSLYTQSVCTWALSLHITASVRLTSFLHLHRHEVINSISLTMLCNERQSSAAPGRPRLELPSDTLRPASRPIFDSQLD